MKSENNFYSDGHLTKIYHLLFKRFGKQHWWPGDTPFEVITGAILTQNTSWKNVARAIENLKNADSLNPEAIFAMRPEQLSGFIRPSGFYRIKTKRVMAFIDHLFSIYDGSLNRMFNQDLGSLRAELLGIKGIGKETADSIILYAAQKPIFVVDAYTKRVFSRHGFFPETWTYDQIQSLFMDSLPKNVDLYNEYHALIVRVAKEHCRKRPICDGCPLEKERIDVKCQS